MLRLDVGELIALQHQQHYYLFLLLSKSAFFGCQWSFALHQRFEQLPELNKLDLSISNGFIALVDFIDYRRSKAITRLAKKLPTDDYLAFTHTKALIRSYPFDGTALWYIYDRNFIIQEKKPTLAAHELAYPIASGMHAHEAFELIDTQWTPEILATLDDEGHYPRRKQAD